MHARLCRDSLGELLQAELLVDERACLFKDRQRWNNHLGCIRRGIGMGSKMDDRNLPQLFGGDSRGGKVLTNRYDGLDLP